MALISSGVQVMIWRSDSQACTRSVPPLSPFQRFTSATLPSSAFLVVVIMVFGQWSPWSIVLSETKPRMPVSIAARPIASGCGPPASAKQVVPTEIMLA